MLTRQKGDAGLGVFLEGKGPSLAFGQESKTGEGTELETGSAEILKRPAAQLEPEALFH